MFRKCSVKYSVALLCLQLFVCIDSNAQTGWYIVTSPTSEDLYDIRRDPTFVTWTVGDNGTILKSTDTGETWEVIPSGTSASLRSLHLPSSGNYWIAGSGGTVIVSTNQGSSWVNRSPATSENLRWIFSRSSGVAYVVGEDGTIFKSTNTGVDWTEQTSGTSDHLNAGIGPTSGTSNIAVVAGENGTMEKTTDGGATWFPVDSGTSEDIWSFVGGPTGQHYLVGTNGIIRESTDAGDSWHPLVSPTAQDLYSVGTSGQNANWSGASGANGTLIKSTDAGGTWFRQASPTTQDLYGYLMASNSTHVAVGANGTIIRTGDGGGGAVSPPGNNALALDGDGDYVTVPHDTSLSFTTEFSVSTWARTDSLGVSSLVRKGQTNTPAWSLNNQEGPFILWLHVNGSWTPFAFSTISVAGQWYYVTGTYNGLEVKLYIDGILENTYPLSSPVSTTTDSLYIGADHSQEYLSGSIDEVTVWNRALTEQQIQVAMAGDLGPEYYITADSGLAGYWKFDELEDLGVRNDGPDDVRDFSVNGNHGDLVGDATLEPSGIPTELEELSPGIPDIFNLAQNYPNPFNPTTTFRYTLPEQAYVTLLVYNILGQEVAALVDEKQDAGYREAQWNALDLASGVYLYRIEARSVSTHQIFTSSKKMLLIK